MMPKLRVARPTDDVSALIPSTVTALALTFSISSTVTMALMAL
jgi:hypothetical protein